MTFHFYTIIWTDSNSSTLPCQCYLPTPPFSATIPVTTYFGGFFMEEKHYSIGEVSKLANISVQTLRYYDQIDLFKPSYVDPQTNYRYYKDAQLYYLDII